MERKKIFNSIFIATGLTLGLFLGAATAVFPLSLEKGEVVAPSGLDVGLLGASGLFYDRAKDFILVANTAANQVAVLNRRGAVIKVLGRKGELRFPISVAASMKGVLYIAQRADETIRVLEDYESLAGEEYHTLELSAQRLKAPVQPSAIHVDREGKLYVVDRGNHQVLVFGNDEKFRFSIQNVGEPTDVTVESGNIYLSAPAFGEVRVYNERGRWVRTLGTDRSRFREPFRVKSLAVDVRGRIWALAESGRGLKAIDSAGNLLFSSPPMENLIAPVGLAVDAQNNLYVLDQGKGSIQIYRISEF